MRRLLLILPLLLLLALPAGAQAAAARLAMAEQDPSFFVDPRFRELGIRDARLVVSWDMVNSGWETEETDKWMAMAREAGVNPMVTFGHSRAVGRELYLPTVAEFRDAFRWFHARYPFVTDFQTWNEANHSTQPTRHYPKRAAKFYNTLRKECPTCKISAPAVLDGGSMLKWLKKFRKGAKKKPKVWSVHNYADANYRTKKFTKLLLKKTKKGELWFTETGGIANRWVDGRQDTRFSVPNQTRATKQVFKLAKLSKRVTRIYFYHWLSPPEANPRWDSAFIGPDGLPRPAYEILKKQAAKRKLVPLPPPPVLPLP
jgi:hypothetical protein